MILGVSWLDGALYLAGADGLPGPAPIERPSANLQARTARLWCNPVVMVHGFRHDPRALDGRNPHRGVFTAWRGQLLFGMGLAQGGHGASSSPRDVLGFGWYSVPAGLGAVLQAWRHGRYNTYRWAWDLAAEAGRALAKVMLGLGAPCDLLCHSLGSRVVIEALRGETALPVRNVVLMNGAELAGAARVAARANPHVRFVNFVVGEDDVLAKFGAVFAPEGGFYSPCVGQAGLGACSGVGLGRPGQSQDRPGNWIDVVLDDPDMQIWGARHGWALRGDNPDAAGDHFFTYRHRGNHGLIRAALDGEPLDPPAVRT